MKRNLIGRYGAAIVLSLFMVMGCLVSQSLALSLPAADFQGYIAVDLDGNLPIINTVAITGYIAENGLPNTLVDPNDPFVGQDVWGFGFTGINYDWQNDILTINSNASANFLIGTNSDPYLTATAFNIKAIQLGNRHYTVSTLLTNHYYYHTADSTFMQQFQNHSVGSDISKIITWDIVFDLTGLPTDYDYGINVSGKIAPVPEPATILLFGVGLIGLAGVARRKVKK